MYDPINKKKWDRIRCYTYVNSRDRATTVVCTDTRVNMVRNKNTSYNNGYIIRITSKNTCNFKRRVIKKSPNGGKKNDG